MSREDSGSSGEEGSRQSRLAWKMIRAKEQQNPIEWAYTHQLKKLFVLRKIPNRVSIPPSQNGTMTKAG